MYSISAAILLFFILMCVFIARIEVICKKFGDIISFRWILWFIIKVRAGKLNIKKVAVSEEPIYEAQHENDDEDPWNTKNVECERRKLEELKRQGDECRKNDKY